MCYRSCVFTSLAILGVSECSLSMKYYSEKWRVQIDLRIVTD